MAILPHDTSPFVRSEEEALTYLTATFPKSAAIIRVMKVANSPTDVAVSVGGAFGCGRSYDAAIARLMTDRMIHLYVE